MEKIKDQFYLLLEKISKQNKRAIPKSLLSIDPGETTGWALFRNGQLYDCGHLDIKNQGLEAVYKAFQFRVFIDCIVIEDYKIYPNKLKLHTMSNLMTPRIIGAFEYLAILRTVPIYFQMAGTAKGFCTNDKLRKWNYWIKGQKHSRDAIRHGCYWLLFGKR